MLFNIIKFDDVCLDGGIGMLPFIPFPDSLKICNTSLLPELP